MKLQTFRLLGLSGFSVIALMLPAFSESMELIGPPFSESFREVESWRTVAGVSMGKGSKEITVKEGEGKIVLNAAVKDTKIPYLLTKEEFGDVKIELEFMIPTRSNAGVYVMGRYEVQIFDSYGREKFNAADMGGIYQRYDPTKEKGKEGSEGTRPLVNAAKPPGEWQTMEIHFRAPEFNAEGKKIKDATFEKVVLNGKLIQENATTTGHTQAAPFEGNAASGPIAIQGDHGPIAIRSFKVTPLKSLKSQRLEELDAYWKNVSELVKSGDFPAYEATFHQDAILVTGIREQAFPIAQVFKKWAVEFADTKAGKIKAAVDFRFSHRYGSATAAHEKGIFRYSQTNSEGVKNTEYVGFEALLIKKDGTWQAMMEYQKELATASDWDALVRE